MKTIKQFGIVLTLALTVLLSSCSSDDNGGGGGGNAPQGTLKAKVGGSNFTSMQMATTAQKVAVGGGTYTITIQGSDSNGKAIILILNGVNGQPGTFEISQTAAISAVASYSEMNMSNPMNSPVWAAPYDGSGVAGSITISEITDTNIKGSFNFTGKKQNGTDTKNVTNGAFNVGLTSH